MEFLKTVFIFTPFFIVLRLIKEYIPGFLVLIEVLFWVGFIVICVIYYVVNRKGKQETEEGEGV